MRFQASRMNRDLQSPANQVAEAQWRDKLTYQQLVQYVQNDHKQWNLAWQPILEGPADRFDEVFLPTDLMPQDNDTLTLTTIKGQSIAVSRRALALAGGGNFQLGAASGVNMRHWAVVIGVDAYPSPFQSLKYAADDAKAVAQVFQEAGVNVTLMTPDSLIQPTKANVIEQLQRHAQLEAVDLLTVYLSGHGEDVDGTGYFLPMDVTDPLSDSGLSLENLFAILNGANAKHRFIIVDACRVAPKAQFVAALSRYSEESNIIFTACDSNQWAPEVPRLRHGLFTYFLLKGLRGDYPPAPRKRGVGKGAERGVGKGAAGPDGTVTVLGLLDYVTRGIEDWHSHLPEELRYPQQITPRVFYNGKYISLLNNQGIDPAVINNEGLLPQITDGLRNQIARNLELLSPLERNDGVTPPTPKGGDLHLPLTISLIPGLSTTGFQDFNRNITTNLSLNIISGYHTKLDGIELGGVLNIKGVEARGMQFAGVSNIVGGDVDGFQISGGLNAVGRDVEGFQASSSLNVNGRDLNGFQAAAGFNATGRNVRGFQAAGGGNFAGRNLQGWQIAPGLNLVGRNVLSQGLQMAAGVNIAGNLEGTQISAAANISLGWNQEANIRYAGTQIGIGQYCVRWDWYTDWASQHRWACEHSTGGASQRLRSDVRYPDWINQFC